MRSVVAVLILAMLLFSMEANAAIPKVECPPEIATSRDKKGFKIECTVTSSSTILSTQWTYKTNTGNIMMVTKNKSEKHFRVQEYDEKQGPITYLKKVILSLIENPTRQDFRNYTLAANNTVGSASATTYVRNTNVNLPPIDEKNPSFTDDTNDTPDVNLPPIDEKNPSFTDDTNDTPDNSHTTLVGAGVGGGVGLTFFILIIIWRVLRIARIGGRLATTTARVAQTGNMVRVGTVIRTNIPVENRGFPGNNQRHNDQAPILKNAQDIAGHSNI